MISLNGRLVMTSILASRGRLRQVRRTIEALVALFALFLLLGLVFSPPAEHFCDGHSVGCGLLSGFASTTLILLGGYFFLFSWTLRRVVGSYTEMARETPERFFPTPPRLGAEPGKRKSLTYALSRELAFSRQGAPILVVGKAGAGKTTFLLSLMRHLAENGAVPVFVPLRTASLPLDLRSLAEKAFLRHIDPVIRSEGDAQRIWRLFCREGAIVVLADGLDELAPEVPRYDRDYRIRAAFTAARNDRLPVLITSRPEAVPAGGAVSQFELEELPEEEALRYLKSAVHVRKREDVELLYKIVRKGRVTQTPFYLDVIASLYRAQRLSTRLRSTDELLVRLLDKWISLVQKERFLAEVELEEGERETIIEGLASVAYAMTYEGVLDCSVSRLKEVFHNPKAAIPAPPSDLGMVIEGASRLELIRVSSVGDDAAVRFNHAISQAHLTSRFLARSQDAWRSLIERTTSMEMREALLMWCVRKRDPGTAERVSRALLKRATAFGDDRALALVVTAAEIASSVGLSKFPQLAGDVEEEAWGKASPRGKVAAVTRLAGRKDPWVFARLYETTRDRNYRVRWSAARAIVDGGAEAYAELASEFADLLDYGESVKPAKWNDREKHDLSVVGWILPAFVDRVCDADRARLNRDLDRLTALVRHKIPLGTEASIAQGFKLGAFVNREADLLHPALELLDDCRFWYSRIVLLQAICVGAITRDGTDENALDHVRATRRDEREHPFVREAARLCERAIKTGAWPRYVWEDENSVITRSGSALAKETLALVADLVLLLNVTEQGGEKVREKRKEETYDQPDLPYCLSVSKDRHELLSGCHEHCRFKLCPYPSTNELALARDEFSQAFCRHQIETLRRVSRMPALFRRERASWWSNAKRTALGRFWTEMEQRAA
jgi:hypothetical protein